MEAKSYYTLHNIPAAQRKELLVHLSGFIFPERYERLQEILALRTRHVAVILEDLYQTQNISAVLRTCECYGVQDVHIIENVNQFQVHKTIAMGANKWLTLRNYSGETGLHDCIANLKRHGYKIAATLPAEKSFMMNQLPLAEKTAFLFGTELNGLSDHAVALADCCVKIPMYGFTESLNVSNSAAILLSYFVDNLRKSSISWKLTRQETEELLFEWLQKSVKMADLLIDSYLKNKN